MNSCEHCTSCVNIIIKPKHFGHICVATFVLFAASAAWYFIEEENIMYNA